MIYVRKQLMSTICLLASSLQCFGAVVPGAEPAVPVMAIWHQQQLGFTFRSDSIFYSCDGLRKRIAAILRAVGAHEGVSVKLPCHPGGLTNNAFTVITVASPVEATAENVARATTYSTRERLVARLNQIDLPSSNDVHRFPAEWRTAMLGRKPGLNLDASDCELVRALSEQIFPQLAVRVEKRRFSCPGMASSRMRPRVQVRALLPTAAVPMAYAGAAQ